MQLQIDKLGKVSITIEEGYWDINKDYDKLTVVEKQGTYGTFISRKPVPAGTVLTNREYWIPFSSLKEEIIIDYNKFINKYQPIIDDIVNRLNDEARLSKNIILVTYEELKTKRDEGSLIPGLWYQITDYEASTTQDHTNVGAGQFDILVLATSNNTLSEEAKAVRHEGNIYYPDYVQFNAWKIWYCLDNDTSRFFWADEENGKGVIYRMIDEFGNDCPYDFKNIVFEFNGTYVYTFNSSFDEPLDASIFENGAKNNKITPLIKTIEVDYNSFETQLLNNIILINRLEHSINAEEYSQINIKNNLFINCYDSVILRPTNNVIINSSINLASECTNNNIQNCIFDIVHDSDIYPEFTDGIHLVGNTIQNSIIHERKKDTVDSSEEFYDIIKYSTVINMDILDGITNIIKITNSYINSFEYGAKDINYCYININDSNIFDLRIDSNSENVTIQESFISNTSIFHNFGHDETRKYIGIYDSNITHSIDIDIVDIHNSTIENTKSFVCPKPINVSSIKQVTYFHILNNELLYTELKYIRDINSKSLNLNDITYATLYIDRHGDLIIDKR